MIIAAYAIGASKAYVYIRAEYPLAVTRVRKAVRDAEAAGLLGGGLFGTDFAFRMHVEPDQVRAIQAYVLSRAAEK